MSKCEHGLTSAECFVCASPKYGKPAAPAPSATADEVMALALKMYACPAGTLRDEAEAALRAAVEQIVYECTETRKEWRVQYDRAERAERERDDFKAKWYQSNRDLHAAWERAEKAEQERESIAQQLVYSEQGKRNAIERAERAELQLTAANELRRESIIQWLAMQGKLTVAEQACFQAQEAAKDLCGQLERAEQEAADASMVATRFEEENVRLLQEAAALRELLKEARRTMLALVAGVPVRNLDEQIARIDTALKEGK